VTFQTFTFFEIILNFNLLQFAWRWLTLERLTQGMYLFFKDSNDKLVQKEPCKRCGHH